MEEKGEQRAKCDPNGRAKAGRKWKDYILGAEPPGETEIRGQSWSLNGGRSGAEGEEGGSGQSGQARRTQVTSPMGEGAAHSEV